MSLVPWSPEEHFDAAQAWAAAHGRSLAATDIPRVGFVADDAAVGWLYQTDSGLGLLETFVTNPAKSCRARRKAVDEVGVALIAAAKGLGITRLVATTGARSIGRMCLRRGFAYAGPMHVLTLEV